MTCNCENCKFHNLDYDWDDDLDDEIEIEICEKGRELPLEEDFDCPDFKKYRQQKYKEIFTECDRCEFVSSCENAIESTTKWDRQRHFVKGMGYCRKNMEG